MPKHNVSTDLNTGNLIRENTGAELNIYDYAAVEAALRIKDTINAHICVFTMGPKSAESALRETLALGIDEAYLISDAAFRGADVLATSYTLAHAISSVATFDIIICGKQTTDGDTAQVPGELASQLNYTYIPWMRTFEEISENSMTFTANMGDSMLTLQSTPPLVLSVEPNSFLPRTASLSHKLKSRKQPINILTQEELALDAMHIGSKGSPTRVVKIHKREKEKANIVEKLSPQEVFNRIKNEINALTSK